MKNLNFKSILSAFVTFILFTASLNVSAALEISNSIGSSIVKLNQATVVDANFTLVSDEPISAMQVIIANLSSGDILSFDQSLADTLSITGSYDSAKGILVLSATNGAATDTAFQSLLRTVTLTASQDRGERFISFSVGEDVLFNHFNNHFYQYIEADAISWSDANTAAQSTIYQGMTGYLVTVTNQEENDFVVEKINGNSWTGAQNTDLNGTNQWEWVTGPESGQAFWQGMENGMPLNDAFSNWDNAEPNNYQDRNEIYGHLYADGTWNDYPDDAENGFSGNDIAGYVIEFGDETLGEIPKIASTKTVQVGTSNAPIFTNNDGALTVSTSIPEKTTYIETIVVIDDDNTVDELNLIISDNPSNAFTLENGELHFINPIDLDGDAQSTHTVVVSVTDTENNTTEQTFTITVLLDSDEDLDPNITDPDDDNDGIPDVIENNQTDGILDNDFDGIINSLDHDSDNDGISDTAEAEIELINDEFVDSDNDGIVDQFDADVTLGTDANNDGIDDALFAIDTDNDGVSDFLDLDSDNDSILDSLEATSMATGGSQAPSAIDIDGDGLVNGTPELITTPSDSDNDGIPDYKDLDADGDDVFDISTIAIGILDENNDGMIDGTVDPDGDGIIGDADFEPNKHGSSDDVDHDGIPSSIDGDDDNDGIPDAQEGNGDTDGDGVIDRLDPDSDGDGISDQIESGSAPLTGNDADQDGIDDAYDADLPGIVDMNNDGVQDINQASLAPVFDLDSDDDGLSDNQEQLQSPAVNSDSDFDGIDDAFDVDFTGGVDLNSDGIDDAKLLAFSDFDQDGLLNYLDSDSDNDGWADGLENGDFNENGVVDYLEVDPGLNTAIGSTSLNIIILLAGLVLLLRFKKNKLVITTLSLAVISFNSQALTKYTSCDYTNEHYKRCYYGGGQLGLSLLNPDDSQSTWQAQNSMSGAITGQLGWRFHSNLFTEFELSYLGANTLVNLNNSIEEEIKLHYYTPALYAGGYIFNSQSFKTYNIFAKVGVSAVRNIASSENISITNNSFVQASVVVGAEIQIQPDIFARINLSRFTSDANAVTLSIHRFF